MKRSTTNQKSALYKRALIVPVIVAVGFLPVSQAFADRYDDQIRQLQGQVSGYQAEASRLRSEADTLQNAVNALNAQKMAIQTELDLSQAKLDKLNADIKANEDKLTKQQSLLASTISDLSAESSTSPIELLAGSASIGDFIDRQGFRDSVQDQIQNAISQIRTLKAQLASQKVEVEKVVADQTSQRDNLASKQAEQAELLAQTEGSEANYLAMVNNANSRIGQLRAQQAAQVAATRRHATASGFNIVAGDPAKGGYPSYLANAPINSIVDDWQMFNRQCVSYAAWKVYQKTGVNIKGRGAGDAWQWPTTFGGTPQGSEPREKSVVVWNRSQIGGGYGHVAWVERVNDDGSIYVSQYNYGTPGGYGEMTVSASQARSLWYMYF